MSVWTGAVDALWSTDGNWSLAPSTDDDLSFPSGAQSLSNLYDLQGISQFGSLTFTGENYNISSEGGAGVTVTQGISAAQSSGTSTLALPVTLDTVSTVEVLNQGGSLIVAAPIGGSAGLTKTGAGRLQLTAANTYTGTTSIDAGQLTVDGAILGGTTINTGATLAGTGTVGSVTSFAGNILGGNFANPGVLNVNGDLALNEGSVFTLEMIGGTVGSGYGQVKVAGAVNLNGTVLNPTLGFTPTGNATFTIIDNTGDSATTGNFDGLPEGSILNLNGEQFRISYQGGTGNDVVLTHLVASQTSLQASNTAPVFGQTVSLTATVTDADGGTPTGNVEFFNGLSSLGVRALTAGAATLDISTLPFGTNTITAQYLGDAGHSVSGSTGVDVAVSRAQTNVALSALPTLSVYGQSVALTATLTAVAPGSGIPTGTVEFFVGSTSLGLGVVNGNGVASINTTQLPLGASSIVAKYAGDTNFAAADSSPLNYAVGQSNTTTTLTALPNPSTLGQSVMFTATVQASTPGSGTPTGTVRFLNGSTEIGVGTLVNGVATLETTALPGGVSTLTAAYSGDVNFAAGTSSPITHQTTQGTTATSLNVAPNQSTFGQSVILTASVTTAVTGAPTISGNVQFFRGTTAIGTSAVVNGVATLTLTNLPVGENGITASYQGDTNYLSSTSSSVTSTVSQTATTTTLLASPNPSVFGQAVTLTATVAAVAPGGGPQSGVVEFFNGTASIGTGTVSNGIATLTLSNLPLGDSTLTASYKGDANSIGSNSAAVVQKVGQATSTVTVTASDTTPAAYNRVTLTATVKPTSGTGVPTGTILFYANGLFLGAGALTSGAASLSLRGLPIGAGVVTAVYSGDTNNLAGNSAGLSIVVGNPIQQFVNQIYVVSMGRQVDLQSMLFWENRFAAGVSTTEIARTIYNSTEAKQNAVRSNYVAYLGRPSTASETVGGVGAESRDEFGSKPIVLGSRGYYKNKGQGTSTGYIAALGNDLIGGAFAPSVQASLKRSLARGTPLPRVATQALSVQASKEALVQASYVTILGREASAAEVADGVKMLNRKVTLRQFNSMLISSQEFLDTYSNQ